MLTIQGYEQNRDYPDARLYLWSTIAGLAALSIASFYCAVHGAVAESLNFDLGETLGWALPRWGIWPILMPACYGLYSVLRRRWSDKRTLAVVAMTAVFCNSVFAWAANQLAGGRWTLLEAGYYTTPHTVGALALVLLIAIALLRPSVSPTPADVNTDPAPDPVFAEESNGLAGQLLDARQIDWVRGARNYVEVRAAGATSIQRMTLSALEAELADAGLLRVHRSFLINRHKIVALSGNRSRPIIVLACGERIPIGKSFRPAVLAALEGIPRAN